MLFRSLRGTPIIRHDAEWQMVYNPHPPYELLQNRLIDFPTMQKLRRFARYWDLVGNSGNFVETTPLIWSSAGQASRAFPIAPFAGFMGWSEWLHGRVGRTDSIALVRLMELLFEFLTGERQLDPRQTAAVMWRDYQRGGRHDKPAFLKDLSPEETPTALTRRIRTGMPKRQARHLA